MDSSRLVAAVILVVSLFQHFVSVRPLLARGDGEGEIGTGVGLSATSVPGGSRNKYAYVTLLCDDVMAEAAMVMVHSVRRTGTPHDIVILTMNVSNRTLESLVALGAKIEPILEPVPYPFAVTADRLAINKPCRYSKLLMWNMVRYRKLIYLDSDLLVLHNIDDLFHRPQLSAAPDTLPPDKFNSGLMVVEPNRAMAPCTTSTTRTMRSCASPCRPAGACSSSPSSRCCTSRATPSPGT
ncbi:unnamed protein product [Closterium sp. NIES-54]